MTKSETNALRIVELLYPNIDINGIEKYKEFFSTYNGLMPIVFECNSNSSYGDILNISIYYSTVVVYVDSERKNTYWYYTESKFIEAIQLACIKYLELKNG